VTTLGDDSDDGLWSHPVVIARAPDGRYFVQANLEGPAPFIFSEAGDPLGRIAAHGASASLVSLAGGAPALLEHDQAGSRWIRRLDVDDDGATIDLPRGSTSSPAWTGPTARSSSAGIREF